MKNNLPIALMFGVALSPGIGHAMGFGEVNLQSRIGEALQAEIPVFVSGDEKPQSACFSLAKPQESDLPAVTGATVQLIRRGQSYFLQIAGHKPISHPLFAFSLRADCGFSMARDYVLMPDAPMPRETDRPWGEVPVTAPKAAGRQLNPASSANDRDAAPKQARTPPVKRTSTTAPRAPAVRPPSDSQSADMTPIAATPAKQDAKAASDKRDRLLLGAANEPLKNGSDPDSLENTEARIQKLEMTLRQLTEEIDKVDAALDQAVKTLAEQSAATPSVTPQQATASAVLAGPPPVVVERAAKSANGWLELVVSAILGGSVVIAFTEWTARRRMKKLAPAATSFQAEPLRTDSLPVAGGVATRAPLAETVDTKKTPVAMPVVKAVEVDEQLVENPPSAAAEVVEYPVSDDDSVLQLAEIMLTFGRLRGAADTLAEHIAQNSPDNILPWSMLLDLYRRSNMQSEFEALAKTIRGKFNVHIPAWADRPELISGLKSLEDYAHLMERIVPVWGTQLCLDYLYGLTRDTRAGQRSGFPLEVVEEIALLMHVLEQAHDLRRPARQD